MIRRGYLSLIVENATNWRNIGYPQDRNCEGYGPASIGECRLFRWIATASTTGTGSA
jgi:hypothetical protein